MTLIDFILVFVIALSVLFGWHRGLLLGVLDLVRWIGSLLVALRFYASFARLLESHTSWSEIWLKPAAFLILLFTTGAVINLIGWSFMRGISRETHKRFLNRLLGIIPGFINGVITAAIITPLLFALPLNESLRTSSRESTLANQLASVTDRLEEALSPVFNEAIRETLNMRTVEPDSGEAVALPFVVSNPRPRPDLEAQMLEMVNKARVEQGLGPLAADPELTEVARRHSTDMFKRGYFAHNNPDDETPFDRISKAGIRFRTAGENLALAPSLQIAHTGLMRSPGHRANILRRQFGRLGIGIMDGGWRGLMVSQEFRD